MNLEQLEAYRANEPIQEHNGIPLETWEKLLWPDENHNNMKRVLVREHQAALRAQKYATVHGLHIYRHEIIRDSDDKCSNFRVWFRPIDETGLDSVP